MFKLLLNDSIDEFEEVMKGPHYTLFVPYGVLFIIKNVLSISSDMYL